MDSKKEIEPGMVFKNREGEEYEVVREYATNDGLPHFLIRFRNPESWQVVPKRSIGRLMLSNKAKKFVYGVGYVSSTEDNPVIIDELTGKIFERWKNIITRCYDKAWMERHPAYRGTTICEEWHDFSNFLAWAKPFATQICRGWDLDKDLMGEGLRIYSPETCVFLPMRINSALAKRRYWENKGKVSGSAKMMLLFEKEIEEKKTLIPATAYERLKSVVSEYRELYKAQTGKDLDEIDFSGVVAENKKRGRRVTDNKVPLMVRITKEAAEMIGDIKNKSEYIDELIKAAKE